MALRYKFFLFVAALAAFFGTALGLLLKYELPRHFRQELEKRGISIARHIARTSVGEILARNPLALNISAHTRKKDEEDIVYILYFGAAPDALLAHTFGETFPMELLGVKPQKSGPGYEIAYVQTEGELVYDIRVPVSRGELGFVRVGLSAEPIQQHIRAIGNQLLQVILAVFVLTLALAAPFAFGLTRPLTRLSGAVKKVAGGDLEQQVPEGGSDELGELARAFNLMVRRLGEARQELLSQNRRLEEEVCARQLAEQRLDTQLHFIRTILDELPLPVFYKDDRGVYRLCNRAYENALGKSRDSILGRTIEELLPEPEAQQHARVDRELLQSPGACQYELKFSTPANLIRHAAFHKATFTGLEGEIEGIVGIIVDLTNERELDQLRREFISTTAHEFQTPLTAILGFCELLLSSPAEPLEQEKYLNIIYERAGFLSRMVHQLLDVERIESDRNLPLRTGPVQLETLIKKILNQRPQSSSHLFDFQFPRPCPSILADADRLSQAFENLINNAVKYSPPRSSIRIGAQAKGDRLHLFVANEGPGLSEEQRSRIFEKFYRAHSGNSAPTGNGLGLYITRAIIEAHGGTILVDSAPGEGVRFEMDLPLYHEEHKSPMH